MEKSSEYVSGLSKKALIFGIVCVALVCVFNDIASYRRVPWWFNRVAGWQYFDPVAMWGYLAAPFIFWLFIVALLSPVLRFKRQELAVIYAMIFVAQLVSSNQFGFSNWFRWVVWPGWTGAYASPLEPVLAWVQENWQYRQWLFPDPTTDVYAWSLAGGEVPAAEIWPWVAGETGSAYYLTYNMIANPVTWRVLVFASIFLFELFLLLIIRRRMIKEELQPFPLASAPAHLIESAAAGSIESKIAGIFKNKYLWIGLLVGTVMQAGYWYGGVIRNYHVAWNDIRSSVMWVASAEASIPILLVIIWGVPWVWAIGLLTPIEVSTTFVGVWTVIGLAIPAMLHSTGAFQFGFAYQWMNIFSDSWDYGAGWNATMAEPNWLARYGFTPIAFAGYIWIIVWMLYSGRRSIIAGIKSIVTPNPEIDKDEALPYRWLYIGLGLSLLAHLVASALVGAILWLVVFGLIMQAIVWIGYTRVRAEGGGFGTAGCPPNWSHSAFAGAGDEIQYLTGNMWMSTGGFEHGTWSSYTTQWLAPIGDIHTGPTVYSDGHTSFLAAPAWYMLEWFKVGDLTETKPRSIFYGAIIALIVGLGVTVPLFMYDVFFFANTEVGFRTFGYALGPTSRIYGMAAGFGGAYFLHEGAQQAAKYEGIRAIGDPDFGWYILIWVVVFAALTMVRTRFPRFIFNPIGLIMASFVGLAPSFYFPMIVTLVLNVIVTRYVGARAYKDILLPIAVGLLVAQGLYWFVDMSVMTIVCRFFVPA